MRGRRTLGGASLQRRCLGGFRRYLFFRGLLGWQPALRCTIAPAGDGLSDAARQAGKTFLQILALQG